MNAEPVAYHSISLSGGVNQRLDGQLIADDEATLLYNVDISVPARREKRMSPQTEVVLNGAATTPVNGMVSYNRAGNPYIVATCAGKLYEYDGSVTPTGQTGATISSTKRVRMVQALKGGVEVIYGTDGENHPFKWNGTTWSQPTINDASAARITEVNDLLWFKSRMWYALGDTIHFSDVLDPETVAVAGLRVRAGAGDEILRMIPFRENYILVFKGGITGAGSIHMIDTSNATPSNWSIVPVFHDISITSPDAIVRAGLNTLSDVFYFTREGVRSVTTTDTGTTAGVTLPLSFNLKSEIDSLNWAVVNNNWGVVFDDEYLLFVATDTEAKPNKVFAYTMKPPKQNQQQGWTVLDAMPAFSGCVVGFSSGKPSLYIGTNTGGEIQKAFSVMLNAGTDPLRLSFFLPASLSGATGVDAPVYTEISKKLTFGSPYQEKRLMKMIFRFDSSSAGTLNVYVIYENGEEVQVGAIAFNATAVRLTQTLPFTLRTTSIQEKELDLHYDLDDAMVRRSRDFRIKLTSNDAPVLLGYIVQALMYPYRYSSLRDDTAVTYTAYSIGGTDGDTDDEHTAEALGD